MPEYTCAHPNHHGEPCVVTERLRDDDRQVVVRYCIHCRQPAPMPDDRDKAPS